MGVVAADEIDRLFDAALDSMQRGDAAGAVRGFEEVLSLAPHHSEARHGLIRALEDSERVEEALAAVRALIESEPDDVLAWTRLSMICQHNGMIAEAEAAAARAKVLGWKLELRGGARSVTDL